MKDPLDRQLKEKAKQSNLEMPEVIRQRMDQALASLPDRPDIINSNYSAKYSNTNKYKFPKWVIGAAIVAGLIAGIAWYKMPVFADIVRSLFSQKNAPDSGLLQAEQLGLVQHPNIGVTNNGYTIKVNEAVADPTRAIMTLEIYGPDGAMNRDLFLNNEAIVIKDDKGKTVGTMYDIGGTTDFYYMWAVFDEPLQTKSITIEANITSLKEAYTHNIIQGKWKFQFTIDLNKANKQTRIIPITGNYTSPDGMSISLKRITRMIQGVRLELDTQLSEKALKRSPGELWKEQEIRFHIEDDSGNHIINVSSADPNPNVLTSRYIIGEKVGEMHWSYTFSHLPADQPYYLVFDGYLVKERDGHSLTFDPVYADYPVHFDSMGDHLKLGKYVINHENDDPDNPLQGTFPIAGTVQNQLGEDEYVVMNEQGNMYTTSGRGAYTLNSNSSTSAGVVLDKVSDADNSAMGYELRIQGLDRIPEQITFIRTKVMRWYGNTDWKIKVQEAKSSENKTSKN